MATKTIVMPISLPKTLAQAVDRAVKARSMTRSEYMRDIIRRDMAFRQLDEFRKLAAPRAKRAGLDTIEGAVKAVREIRDQR